MNQWVIANDHVLFNPFNKTNRSRAVYEMDYAVWCQDVSLSYCLKRFSNILGARFIRAYFKACNQGLIH